MSEEKPEATKATFIRINQQKLEVDTHIHKSLTYSQLLKITKSPFGATVFYISTKGKSPKTGIVEPNGKIEIEDGLDISVMIVNDPPELQGHA